MSIESINSQSVNFDSLTSGRSNGVKRRCSEQVPADSGDSLVQAATQGSSKVSTMSDAELEIAAAKGDVAAQQELAKRQAAASDSSSTAVAAAGQATASEGLLDILA